MTQPGVRDREMILMTDYLFLRISIAAAAQLASSQLESSPTFPTGATDNRIDASITDAKFLGRNMVIMTADVRKQYFLPGWFSCPAFV